MRTWLISISLVCLIFLGLIESGRWLLYSPAGTQWLLTRLADAQNVKIGRIEGTLVGQLQLSDIRSDRLTGQLDCRRVLMSSRILSIFPLHLGIEQLHVEGLTFNSRAVEQQHPAPLPAWPTAPWWSGLPQIDLRQLIMSEFDWRQEDQPKLRIDLLQGAFSWRDGSMQAQQLFLQTPELQAESSFEGRFDRPALNLELRVEHRDTTNPWQRIKLSGDLRPSTEGLLLSGPVRLTLAGPRAELLEVSAELGLGQEELQFQQLHLRRPRRSGSIVANGSLRFAGDAKELSCRLQLNELDLQAETGQAIRLSGLVNLKGNLSRYAGDFQLQNRGADLLQASLRGDFSGDQTQLQLTGLRGAWLNGTVTGQVQTSWSQGWQVQARLSGRDFTPQLLHEQLDGRLNLNLQTDLSGQQQSVTGQLQLQLVDSVLHGQPLSGDASLRLHDRQLDITHLNLLGEGLQLQASGNPAERLRVNWRIDRLGQLLSDFNGRLHGNGWLRWQPDGIVAEFTSRGKQLKYRQWQLAEVHLQGKTGANEQRWQVQLNGQQLQSQQPRLKLEKIRLSAAGDLARHQLDWALEQEGARLTGAVAGSWQKHQWQGSLLRLRGEDPRLGQWQLQEPVPLLISAEQLQLSPLQLHSDTLGHLQLQGRYQPGNQQAEGKLAWDRVDLSLLRPWLSDWQVAGRSSGAVTLQSAQPSRLHGTVTLAGNLKNRSIAVEVQQSEGRVDWDEQGLRGSLALQLADGSRLQANLKTADQARLNWPQQGALHLAGQGFSLERLQPWLPPDLKVAGKLDLQTSGRWQAGAPWQIEGSARAAEGRLNLHEEDSISSVPLSAAELNWRWHDRLQGTLALQLQEHGSVEARFDLPLAAEFPIRPRPADPLVGELDAGLQKLGLLSLLSPGRIRDSHGQLKVALQLNGNWEKPILQGNARLFQAGFFLPALGIQLSDIDLSAGFASQRIEIKSLQFVSGGGQLNAQGDVELKGWWPDNYNLQLSGENFQLIDLPELRARVNPELTVIGNMQSYRLRGKLEVPELLITGRQKTALTSNSPDLLILDADVPPDRRLRLQHDIDLQLILGDRVLLKSAGIDAKLTGNLRLQSTTEQMLAASGKIHVVKGRYASYGVSLEIDRGNLFFSGGPPDRPTLDLLALRKIGEVEAGVKVTGTPQLPVVRLYSEPGMAETEILSYIVLGRPLDAGSNQTGLLMTAAGALLSQGESVALQEKLKNRLGLDVLDISAGNGDVASSVITTGKYLSPDLYISLGYSLFNNSNEMKVRYNLSPDWEVESNIGTESGVDLFYKIDIQ